MTYYNARIVNRGSSTKKEEYMPVRAESPEHAAEMTASVDFSYDMDTVCLNWTVEVEDHGLFEVEGEAEMHFYAGKKSDV